ncbi:hypothetical protein [Nocardioides halotolerans]|jgi:hypothetical protein|uniref:hypothetical protein n=1 Tax=Nocardioides halotolerans TaxID=433660 RepID=UPI0004013A97|nr:hypothetical protein [Nocardioides halotolerans]
MRALKVFVATAVGLGGLAVAGAPAHAGKGADPDEVKTVTMPLQSRSMLRSTPIEGGFSNYCAVVTLVPFNDLAGFQPVSVTATFINAPFTESIGEAPYDDAATINNLVFTPSGAAHQTQLGEASYQQGGGDPALAAVECEKLRQRSDDFWGPTATVTYERTDKCAAALAKVASAAKAVKAAQKKVKSTTGKAHAAAVAALNKAKAKLKATKKKAKKACR